MKKLKTRWRLWRMKRKGLLYKKDDGKWAMTELGKELLSGRRKR